LKRLRLLLLSSALIGACGSPARATEEEEPLPGLPPVRVRLASLGMPSSLTVRGSGSLTVTHAATGKLLQEGAPTAEVTATGGEVRVGGEQVDAVRVAGEGLTLQVGRVRRVYPGALHLSASRGRLVLVNEAPLEEYTAGVLASECPAAFHPEAIKAMAVAARSYTYRKAYLGVGELCDTTHCHVYRGIGSIAPSIRAAVMATEGLCALHDEEVIDAVYSADCGGYTEANEDAWKGAKPVPYLRSVPDAPAPDAEPYCAVNRSHRWSLTVPFTRLRSLLGSAASQLRLDLVDLSASGRVRKLLLAPLGKRDGEAEGAGMAASLAKQFTGEQWRRMLGASAVKSLKFDVRVSAAGVELNGRGYGHGVGLCQFGSNGMARQGGRFDEILKHYYQGTRVAQAPDVVDARARITARHLASRGAGSRRGSRTAAPGKP
jgi:stage II sporulation protein D